MPTAGGQARPGQAAPSGPHPRRDLLRPTGAPTGQRQCPNTLALCTPPAPLCKSTLGRPNESRPSSASAPILPQRALHLPARLNCRARTIHSGTPGRPAAAKPVARPTRLCRRIRIAPRLESWGRTPRLGSSHSDPILAQPSPIRAPLSRHARAQTPVPLAVLASPFCLPSAALPAQCTQLRPERRLTAGGPTPDTAIDLKTLLD